MTPAPLDLHDIQGLVARGYGHLDAAAFLLLTIEDAAAGRGWLGEVSGAVTSAEVRRPNRALQVAFTSKGLERLGLDRGTLELFSNEFVTGMTTPHRTRILGDLDENAPARWEWGGEIGPSVDAVLLLYALSDREHQEPGRRKVPVAAGDEALHVVQLGRAHSACTHRSVASRPGSPRRPARIRALLPTLAQLSCS